MLLVFKENKDDWCSLVICGMTIEKLTNRLCQSYDNILTGSVE